MIHGLIFLALLALVACSDGSGEDLARFCAATEALDEAATTQPDISGVEDQAELEQRLQEFFAGYADEIDELESSAPDEIADDVDQLAALFRRVIDDGDFAALQGPQFAAAADRVEAFSNENCRSLE